MAAGWPKPILTKTERPPRGLVKTLMFSVGGGVLPAGLLTRGRHVGARTGRWPARGQSPNMLADLPCRRDRRLSFD